MLRTAVIGVGHLGKQHARIHADLAREGRTTFVAVCDTSEKNGRSVAAEREVPLVKDWRDLVGKVDAVCLATPTESHCEITCELLEAGVSVLVEKPISRTLDEANRMIAAASQSNATLQIGHLERYNPALVALRPLVKSPLYFEIHRIGQFSSRSLDIDVVLDLMIHDLDIVQWLIGDDVPVKEVRAVGIPILTDRVDAANARLDFENGAVANITASRVGMEKIRKMRFFQPHDYVNVDYAARAASISSLHSEAGLPGIKLNRLATSDVEPLRAEIESFLHSIENKRVPLVTAKDGRRALDLGLKVIESIREHHDRTGVGKK